MKAIMKLSGLILILLLIGCKEQKKTAEPEVMAETSEEENIRELKTASGKIFRLTESHPVGASLSTVNIKTEGFKNEFDETLTDIDPITKVFMADLDENGFEELYVMSTGAGSGAYASLHGFASNGDESVSTIYIPEISEDELAPGKLFEGYMGSDGFLILNGVLIREFYKHKEGDPVHEPSGERTAVAHELVAGEATYKLQAKPTAWAEGTLVRNCLGDFLATEDGNFKICNTETPDLKALENGAPMEVHYTQVACVVKEGVPECRMAFPTIGTIKLIEFQK